MWTQVWPVRASPRGGRKVDSGEDHADDQCHNCDEEAVDDDRQGPTEKERDAVGERDEKQRQRFLSTFTTNRAAHCEWARDGGVAYGAADEKKRVAPTPAVRPMYAKNRIWKIGANSNDGTRIHGVSQLNNAR